MNKSIGALWIKEGKKGKFMSGKITLDGKEYDIVIFKNSYKKDKQPDYMIYESQKRADGVILRNSDTGEDEPLPF